MKTIRRRHVSINNGVVRVYEYGKRGIRNRTYRHSSVYLLNTLTALVERIPFGINDGEQSGTMDIARGWMTIIYGKVLA